MSKIKLFFLILFVTSLWSCAPYKIKTQEFVRLSSSKIYPYEKPLVKETLKGKALNHWLYDVIPRHRTQIRWFDIGHWMTWMLFGNDDDGIFGEEEKGKYVTRRKIGIGRALAWNLRNPLHNFCFYTIGTAYWKNKQFTILSLADEEKVFMCYEADKKTDFAGKGTSLYFGLHGWKPFLSVRVYYGRLFEAYIGWRSRGNFGGKLLPVKKSPFRYNNSRGKGKQ